MGSGVDETLKFGRNLQDAQLPPASLIAGFDSLPPHTTFLRHLRLSFMFSIQQKREIADAVQAILRKTNHPELLVGEIQFQLHVDGASGWSWADIQNNGAVKSPSVNPHNEQQDPTQSILAP